MPMKEVLSVVKALGDESRLRALLAVKDGELCLCQIIEVLGLSPATVSKHMNVLERAGLVERRRRGKWRYYRIAVAPASSVAGRAQRWVVEELRGDRQVQEDARKSRKVRGMDLEVLSACYRT
jgi:DNA-binding transcriptional ArsR family regulator